VTASEIRFDSRPVPASCCFLPPNTSSALSLIVIWQDDDFGEAINSLTIYFGLPYRGHLSYVLAIPFNLERSRVLQHDRYSVSLGIYHSSA